VHLSQSLLELRRRLAHRREVGGQRVGEDLRRVAQVLVGDAEPVERGRVGGRGVSLFFDARALGKDGAARELA